MIGILKATYLLAIKYNITVSLETAKFIIKAEPLLFAHGSAFLLFIF